MPIVKNLQPEPAENEHQHRHGKSEEQEIDKIYTEISVAVSSRWRRAIEIRSDQCRFTLPRNLWREYWARFPPGWTSLRSLLSRRQTAENLKNNSNISTMHRALNGKLTYLQVMISLLEYSTCIEFHRCLLRSIETCLHFHWRLLLTAISDEDLS